MTPAISSTAEPDQNYSTPSLLESRSQLLPEQGTRKLSSQPWIARLLQPRTGLKVFSGILLLIYAVIPACLYIFLTPESVLLKLSLLSFLAVAAMWIGSTMQLFDARFKTSAVRLKINSNLFHTITWTIFLVFVAITLITASSIPLISAFNGATADALSQERGDFLKSRVGAEMALMYISTILTSTIVPYSIVLLYAGQSRFRHFFAFLFFVFCVSFLAKALFLNLVFPLLICLAIVNKLDKKVVVLGALGSIFILVLSTMLSMGGEQDTSANGIVTSTASEYMSAAYVPASALDYFVWRAFAVPIFTATDTLLVHAQQFGDHPLMGATSSLLSALFGLERINLERYVFEHQFGSWNEIANANTVFIVDAYANFGYAGVIIFGLFVGQIFRWFRLSSDVGFKSLWLLFSFALFNASLIGMLLSNGFFYMIFHALFFSVVSVRKFYG